MSQGDTIAISVAGFDRSRHGRLIEELAFALRRTDAETLRKWGGRSAGRLASLSASRIGGLASLVKALGQHAYNEVASLVHATGEGKALTHLGDRTAAAIDGSIAFGKDGAHLITSVSRALATRPKENAPRVLGAFLGFYAGSGGLDGNGGIPDLDLLAGIDAHRSFLTHSILAGIVAEALLLSVADLASEVHDRLPEDHDLLWDRLATAASPLVGAVAAGTSAGIAYHLLVDALIQPAPYKDLPIAMPIEGHQALMAGNAAAEAASRRYRIPATIDVSPQGPSEKSTGRRVVDGIASAATAAGDVAQEGVQRVKDYWSTHRRR